MWREPTPPASTIGQPETHYMFRQPILLSALAFWGLAGPLNPTAELLELLGWESTFLAKEVDRLAFFRLPTTVLVSLVAIWLLRLRTFTFGDISLALSVSFTIVVVFSPFIAALPVFADGLGESYLGMVVGLYAFGVFFIPWIAVTIGLPTLLVVSAFLALAIKPLPR